MDAAKRGTTTVPSLPPPRPKSPPQYPDLYGKRRELAKVQMLEREIGFLEEELKNVERIQPASRSCKEVTDFVVANSDPFVTTSHKIRNRRSRRFWKWLCGKSCFNLSWICCCCYGCCEMPRWCTCKSCNSCHPCASCCAIPKCPSCSWPCTCSSQCCSNFSWRSLCCDCQCPSCLDCTCSCSCSCSKFTLCCCQPKCPKDYIKKMNEYGFVSDCKNGSGCVPC